MNALAFMVRKGSSVRVDGRRLVRRYSQRLPKPAGTSSGVITARRAARLVLSWVRVPAVHRPRRSRCSATPSARKILPGRVLELDDRLTFRQKSREQWSTASRLGRAYVTASRPAAARPRGRGRRRALRRRRSPELPPDDPRARVLLHGRSRPRATVAGPCAGSRPSIGRCSPTGFGTPQDPANRAATRPTSSAVAPGSRGSASTAGCRSPSCSRSRDYPCQFEQRAGARLSACPRIVEALVCSGTPSRDPGGAGTESRVRHRADPNVVPRSYAPLSTKIRSVAWTRSRWALHSQATHASPATNQPSAM